MLVKKVQKTELFFFPLTIIISYLYMVILIGRLLNITIVNRIYFLFYHNNLARFGGTWSGLNYIWIIPLLLLIINLIVLDKYKIKFKVFINVLISIFVIVVSILLSGSRTSLVVIIVSSIMAILLKRHYSKRIIVEKSMNLKLNKRKLYVFLLLFIYINL